MRTAKTSARVQSLAEPRCSSGLFHVSPSLNASMKAMRATSQDQDAAAMMGINVNRTISVTFFLAGSLAAVAGLVYLLQFNMRYDTGFELGLIAFTAAVLGGIGNLTGAVLGAMVIGCVQAFNEGLDGTPGGDWTRSIVFGILIAILVFRPQGILGERTPEGA